MPFTPSHAIVALPFARTAPGLAAAVAVGAMTPDLPLFVRQFPITYEMTHHWEWILLTAVLAGGLLALWWYLIRPAVRELSPRPLAERLPEEWDGVFRLERPGRGIAIIAVGLILGVATHIAWDTFTHEGRAGVVALGLDAQWGMLPAYKWLQYGSSVIGLVILFVAGLVWLRRRTPAPVRRAVPDIVRVAWWVSLPVMLVVAWLIGMVVFGPFDSAFTPHHLAYRVLPPVSGAWGLASLVLCGVVQLRRRLVTAV